MKEENKTKAELIKELKTLRKERGENALNDLIKHKQIEEKYLSFTKNIFDSSAVGIFILDPDFKVVWINNAIETYFGLQREEIIGKDKRQLIKKNIKHIFEDPDEFIRKVFATYDNNTYIENFECHVLPDGKRNERWLEHWSQPIKSGLYAGGRIEHYYDITERKQAEQELSKEKTLLKAIIDKIPVLLTRHAPDTNMLYLNKEFEKIVGWKTEEVKDIDLMKKVYPDPDYRKQAREYMQKASTEWREFRVQSKSGKIINSEWSNIRLDDGTQVGIGIDITERKQAEEETRQKTEDLTLINVLNEAVNRGDCLLEILQLLARETKRIFSCYEATAYLLSEDREYLVMQSLTLAPAMISRVEKLIGMKIPAISIPLKTGSLYRKTLQEGKPKLINDPKTIQGLMAEFTENKILKKLVPKIYSILGTRSLINVPLVSEGEAIGLLDISRKEPFTEFDLKRFETISGHLTSIIERKQSEGRVKHLNLVLHAIRDVNQLIVREKNRERLLKGICDNLIKTRGYHNAWIVLLDEEGKFKTCAEDGLGKDFLPMTELLKRGKLTTCSQKALKQQEIVIIEDPASTCTECPLAQKYSGRAGFATRLEHSGKVYGLMTVSIPVHNTADKEEQTLFKEVAEDIAFGLYNIELDEKRKQAEEKIKHINIELKERVKELNCLWEFSNLIESPNISLGEIIKETVNLLPPAWQYSKITCARITLEDKEYKTKNFKETIWKQSSDIKVYKKSIGTVEVYHLEERTQSDEGSFLREERNLINIIAEKLGDLIQEKQSEQKLKQSYQKLKKTMDATIDTMSNMIEAKDPYTSGHQHRVCQLAVPLARELGLAEDKVEGIRIASLIHDIGKIGLPTEILSKPSKLTDIEFNLIKGHSQIGHNILKSIDFPWPVARIVLQHHERLNGLGYPYNLKGDEILPEAKIIGIADVVEAISSHRPYRPALGIDAALEEISKNKGILYDPKIVDVCIKLFKEKGFKFK